MPLVIRGAEASIRWGYHAAATLSPWTITREDGGPYRLSGTLTTTNPYRLSQRPLVVVVPHQAGAWRWPITELQMTGASIAATLGPKE